MVYYSKQVDSDLDELLEDLLTWQKHVLTREFCHSYLFSIIDICDSLDTKLHHFDAVYEIHKKYGKKAHRYSRNKNTTWYIIYDVDIQNNVYINKIISSHLTTS